MDSFKDKRVLITGAGQGNSFFIFIFMFDI